MVVKTGKPLIEGIEPLRKEAEALSESEEKHKALVAASQDAVVEVDEKGRIILWNKGAEQNFGYSAKEILDQPVAKLMAEEYREHHRKGFEGFLNGNRRVKRFVGGEGLRKDGSRFPIEWSLSSWRENGKTIVAAIGKDVSARKQEESKRKQAEELYTIFANSSQIGVYIVQDRRFQFVNPQFQSHTGFSQDELLGIDPLTIVHPEDREMVRENAVKMLKRERSSPYEFRAVTRGGETRWVMETAISIQYQGKRATLGNYMDITERKRAEQALKESEEKYKTLFDSTLDGVAVIDAETFKIASANQAAAEMFGFNSAEEALGVNPFDFIPPNERERVFKMIVKVLSEENSRHPRELQMMTKDGKEIWISAVGTGIEHQGKLAGLVSFRDITERKRAEKRLEDSFIDLAETVSRAIESRDPYTAGHQREVAELAHLVGERMGLGEERLRGLYIGGLLHDIGKVSIPASILTKLGELTEEEWALICTHPKQGYSILKDTSLPWPVADMALHHHERLDGSGYPHGISGDDLSLEVRILAVCDVVEAMGSHRPYRPAKTRKEFLEEIKSGRGTKYDASVVDVVMQIIESGEFKFGWNGRNSKSTAIKVLVP
jgi:PAS domain S-box-containing protein